MFAITATSLATDLVRVAWTGGSNVVQFVEATPSLTDTNAWQVLATTSRRSGYRRALKLDSAPSVRFSRLRTGL